MPPQQPRQREQVANNEIHKRPEQAALPRPRQQRAEPSEPSAPREPRTSLRTLRGDRKRHAREQLDRLTEREREVAVALGQGKPNAEISRELYMSVATVKAHVSRVL